MLSGGVEGEGEGGRGVGEKKKFNFRGIFIFSVLFCSCRAGNAKVRRFEEKTDLIRNKLEAKCNQMEFSRQKIVAHKQQKNGEADTLTNWFQVINYKQRRHQAGGRRGRRRLGSRFLAKCAAAANKAEFYKAVFN